MSSRLVESAHAASIRRKLIEVGSLTSPPAQSSSSKCIAMMTRSSLAYTHPFMCATGIPDMGGGLGVVATPPPPLPMPSPSPATSSLNKNNANNNDKKSKTLSSSSSSSLSLSLNDSVLAPETPIMRVPVRALVTGKSARRWLYQLIIEAAGAGGDGAVEGGGGGEGEGRSGEQHSEQQVPPLLLVCLRRYLHLDNSNTTQNSEETLGQKEEQQQDQASSFSPSSSSSPLSSSMPRVLDPVSVVLPSTTNTNAIPTSSTPPMSTPTPTLTISPHVFAKCLEKWLLSLTSVQCIAMFLFLMREIPSMTTSTATNTNGTASSAEEKEKAMLSSETGGQTTTTTTTSTTTTSTPTTIKRIISSAYVVREDPQRHALLHEWVMNLPKQYDNLLELVEMDCGGKFENTLSFSAENAAAAVADATANESSSSSSPTPSDIASLIWSPHYAEKVRHEIREWYALFLKTMMNIPSSSTTTKMQGHAGKREESGSESDDDDSDDEIISDDDADDGKRSSPNNKNITAQPSSAAAAKVSSSLAAAAVTHFTSFADVIDKLFLLRPDLISSVGGVVDATAATSSPSSSSSSPSLALTIPPHRFLWANNSLMSRGFACDDETWVMMPYVDYFNYGFHEDATDESDGGMLKKYGGGDATAASGNTNSSGAKKEKMQTAAASSSLSSPSSPQQQQQQPSSSIAALCSNISVADRVPDADELMGWLFDEHEAFVEKVEKCPHEGRGNGDGGDAAAACSPLLLLPSSPAEVERLLDFAANEYSAAKRMWDASPSSSAAVLRGEYLKRRVPEEAMLFNNNTCTDACDNALSSSSAPPPSPLSWYQQAEKAAMTAAIIVPSYNPLSVCEFSTTMAVPLTLPSSPTAAAGASASPQLSPPFFTYHQFLLCYGTYMDYEIALWYGFTLTDNNNGNNKTTMGSVKKLQQQRMPMRGGGDGKSNTDRDQKQQQQQYVYALSPLLDVSLKSLAPLLSSSSSQSSNHHHHLLGDFDYHYQSTLLRHHIAHSYSLSSLADSCGNYLSDRLDASYKKAVENYFIGSSRGMGDVDDVFAAEEEGVVKKYFANFKKEFKAASTFSSSSKRGGGGGSASLFVTSTDPSIVARQLRQTTTKTTSSSSYSSSSKRRLHWFKGFASLSLSSSSSTSPLSRLPNPPAFFSATGDLFRNNYKREFRLSKVGITPEMLSGVEHVALFSSINNKNSFCGVGSSGDQSSDKDHDDHAVMIAVDVRFWEALLNYGAATEAEKEREEQEGVHEEIVTFLERFALFQTVFVNRNRNFATAATASTQSSGNGGGGIAAGRAGGSKSSSNRTAPGAKRARESKDGEEEGRGENTKTRNNTTKQPARPLSTSSFIQLPMDAIIEAISNAAQRHLVAQQQKEGTNNANSRSKKYAGGGDHSDSYASSSFSLASSASSSSPAALKELLTNPFGLAKKSASSSLSSSLSSSSSSSVLSVAITLQRIVSGEWVQLESYRRRCRHGESNKRAGDDDENDDNAQPTTGTDHTNSNKKKNTKATKGSSEAEKEDEMVITEVPLSMAEYFGLQASIAQWTLLRDVGNVLLVDAHDDNDDGDSDSGNDGDEDSSSAIPFISLEHCMKLLYLCYDGRGEE